MDHGSENTFIRYMEDMKKPAPIVDFESGIFSESIPEYVSARGEKAEAAYRRALKFGTTKDKRVKIYLIGQDRVGKTSLGRSLKGEPFRKDETSTDGVQMSQPLKNADDQPWKNAALPKDTTAYHHRFAEYIDRVSSVEGFAADGTTGTPDSPHIDLGEEEERRLPDKIAKLVEDPEEKKSRKSDGIWPVIWDFAGQAVFRAIHPIFMSPAAVYILAFDLTKELSAKAQCRVREEGCEEVEIEAPDSDDTNLDHIMRWMDLVRSLKHSDNETLPPVLLVGTHADAVTKGDSKRRIDDLEDALKCEGFMNHIAYTFAVDNTRAGQTLADEDPETVDLRQKVLEMADEMPHTKKEVPLKWLEVEDMVYNLKDSQERNHITRKEFKRDIVDKIGQFENEDDLDALLHFLHDRGAIVYHDSADNPNGLVVLDPQWLIDVITSVISVKQHGKRRERPRIRKLRQDLGEKGILDAELLDNACATLKLEKPYIKESLLLIMKKFNLLCECKGKDSRPVYLVPCMLKEKPEDVLIGQAVPGCAPVYIKSVDTSYVPCGLFSRLLVFFGEWAASKTSCNEQQFYANAARFVIGKDICLSFVCCKTVIKVHIWAMDGSNPVQKEPDVCLELLSVLEKRLTELHSECHWLQSVSWQLCGQCTLPCSRKAVNSRTGKCLWHGKQDCSHEDCAHYIPVTTSPFHCSDARGTSDLKVTPTWIQVLKRNTSFQEQPGVVKQGTPCDDELEGLSREIAEAWKSLGRQLNVTEAELTSFHKENEKYFEKSYKMFLHWKQRDGEDATYRVLHDALCHEHVQRRDLAEKFCLCDPR